MLIVSHYFAPHVGGIEAVAGAEARTLRERGNDVEVLSSAVGAVPGHDVVDGVRVRRVPAWNGLESKLGVPFPIFSPALVLAAWRAVRRAEVVHVHEYLYLCSWVVALVCRITGTPYVLTQHVGAVEHTSSVVRVVQEVVRRTVGRFVLHGARTVMPINGFIARDLRALLGDDAPLSVLGNGVDTSSYRPGEEDERDRLRRRWGLPTDRRLVLFVGRFVPKKGFSHVVAAASPHYDLVFVGGDRPEEVPQGQHFLGARPTEEVREIYRAADAYVGASTGECPLSVLEAMSSGLPAVLNDDPGYRAIGADGPGARYTDVATSGLREALEDLVRDETDLRHRGMEARRAALGSMSWHRHTDRLEAIYLEALSP